MKDHAQELFLLTTTLSQLNNKDRIIRLFIESMNDIFQSFSFEWFKEKPSEYDDVIEVCTMHKNYGFITVKINSRTNTATNKLIHNATQLLAIFLEKIEQEILLLDQKNHLQILVDKQIAELNRTNLSLEKELAVRRYAEEQLEAQNTLLSALINSPNNIIIFSLDKEYCYTAFNEQHRKEMKEVWNVNIEKGMSLLECISDPKLRELAKKSMDRALHGETFFEVQFQPGIDIYYEFKWSPIFQYEDIIGITAFISNITEHKKAGKALRESEQLFRALVESSPDFIARYDSEYRRIYVNPAIQKLFKNSGKDIIGKTPIDKSPIYAPQDYIHCIQQAIETKKEYTIEIPFRTALGEMHWGHFRFLPEFDQNGKVTSVLSIGRDIHEIKENELRFRMLAENFPDFVIRFDHDNRYRYVNRTINESFDISNQAFAGKTMIELPLCKKQEQNNAIIRLVQRTFSEGKTYDNEALWDTKMGERIFGIRYVPEKDATKNVVSVLCIAQDITDRKLAEEEINKMNLELEKRVSERTSQLKAANKELEAFAYSVSHDLRAPLRAIDGFSQILLQEILEKLDEQSKDYLKRISAATKSMGQLIDDLLKLSRVTRSEMNRMEVDLSSISNRIANDIKNSETDRKVKFIIQENIIVNGDERLLRIVMENLLGNAWKFTSKQQTACIELGVLQHEEKDVCFVRDNGVGFEMKYAQKLFGAFQRLHSAQDFSGTGIGLATVQRIIHRHGGEVWAESEVGKGATFYFTL